MINFHKPFLNEKIVNNRTVNPRVVLHDLNRKYRPKIKQIYKTKSAVHEGTALYNNILYSSRFK
ncbi:hypothetical protein C9J48_18660 [Photobacterium profundum]|uniref:Uncharacterized protein n=1 Tax=Photobacterium profundum 3TCK TaxID=314280 RepID=Q1Z8K1_9GAMM|nr:hypothetical protein P3TCK_21525 [Photobacterium profundum 3TCK]PSV60505.1 hypothetical protein C9J48_18660 [Photobacterium profundum]